MLSLALGLLVSLVLVACSGNGDEDDYSNSSYSLSYNGEENTPYLDWENSMKTSWLRLEFDEGIPKGSQWNLYCYESWVKVQPTYGKVNSSSQYIPITIEDNTNYEDREAYIQLDVENGLPADANYTTVTIHQYGYEHYLEWGQIVSFDTDRTLANSNTMKLNIYHMENLVEVDWGDNSKEVYSTKDSYRTLTHQYLSSAQTYRVKLRFGIGRTNDAYSFTFYTDRNQGVTDFYDRNERRIYSFQNNSTSKFVTYKDGEFSFDD